MINRTVITDHQKEAKFNVAVELGYIKAEDKAYWRKLFMEASTDEELRDLMNEVRMCR